MIFSSAFFPSCEGKMAFKFFMYGNWKSVGCLHSFDIFEAQKFLVLMKPSLFFCFGRSSLKCDVKKPLLIKGQGFG